MKTDDDARKVSAETTARRALLGRATRTAAGLLIGGWVASACGDDGAGDARSEDDSDDMKPRDRAGRGAAGSMAAGVGGAGRSGAGAGGASGKGAVQVDADVEPLNALLTAEYNAITAYSAGAGLIMGAKSSDPLYDLRQVIVDIAVDFQSQHKLHAEALVDAIESLGGKPVDEAKIADAFAAPDGLAKNPTISNVLKFAASAERAAAVAYNQVLAGMEDAKFRFLASSIEGDETQHFIVLAALVLGLAAPGPKLSSERAGDVVPEAFVTSIGERRGLDRMPPDYFA